MKHSRAYTRYQRDRWIAKRKKIYDSFFRTRYTIIFDKCSGNSIHIHNYLPEIAYNKFSKKDPFDCGHTNCGICHYYRGTSSYKDKLLSEKFNYDLKDYNGGTNML